MDDGAAAEAAWRRWDDATLAQHRHALEAARPASAAAALACARLQARLGEIRQAQATLAAWAAAEPAGSREHGDGLALRIGNHLTALDFESAAELLQAALTEGLLLDRLPRSLVERVLRMAMVTGMARGLPEAVLSRLPPGWEPVATLIEASRMSLSSHAARFASEDGGVVTVARLLAAFDAQDAAYGSYLICRAHEAQLPLTEDEWVRVLSTPMREGEFWYLAAATSWRAHRACPTQPFITLFLINRAIILSGDLDTARDLFLRLLARDLGTLRHVCDEVLRTALDLAVHGAFEPDELFYLCARLFPHTHNPDLPILVSGHASRSAHHARRSLRAAAPPRPAAAAAPEGVVALCLSGQLRGYRQAWATTLETLGRLRRHRVVVFVSTWADVGHGFGAHDTVDRRLPPVLRNRLPVALRRRPLFEQRYPQALAVLQGEGRVSVADCQQFFGTPHVNLPDEFEVERALVDRPHQFPEGGVSTRIRNSAKMYYGMGDAIRQKAAYEQQHRMKFDAVIRLRPDVPLLSLSDDDLDQCRHRHVLLSEGPRSRTVPDMFFLMNTQVADAVGDIWAQVDRQRTFAIAPGAFNWVAEVLLFTQVAWQGVRVDTMRGSRAGSPGSNEVAPERLWQALLQDLATLDSPGADDLALASALSVAAQAEPLPDLAALRQAIERRETP